MKLPHSERRADAAARAFEVLREFLTEPTVADRMIAVVHELIENCEHLPETVLKDAIINDPSLATLLGRQAATCQRLGTALRDLNERLGEKFQGRGC